MSEYGFSLTRTIPYKDRIFDFVFIEKYAGQWKPVFWHILRNVNFECMVNKDSKNSFLGPFLNLIFKFLKKICILFLRKLYPKLLKQNELVNSGHNVVYWRSLLQNLFLTVSCISVFLFF